MAPYNSHAMFYTTRFVVKHENFTKQLNVLFRIGCSSFQNRGPVRRYKTHIIH